MRCYVRIHYFAELLMMCPYVQSGVNSSKLSAWACLY